MHANDGAVYMVATIGNHLIDKFSECRIMLTMVIFRISGGPLHVVSPKFQERHVVKSVSGWRFHRVWKRWYANNPASAEALSASSRWKIVDFDGPPEDAGNSRAFNSSLFEDHESSAVDTEFMPPAPEGLSYLPFQRAGIEYAMKRGSVLIGDDMGLGKAQPNDEPVLTPSGFVPMGSLSVGDFVVGSDGKPTRVMGVFPQGKLDVYRVTMTDGSWTRCCGDHLWSYRTRNDRARNRDGWRVNRLLDLKLKVGKSSDSDVFIPMVSAVDFDGFTPLDPWLIGALIGDGCFRHRLRFSNPEEDILEAVRLSLPPEMELGEVTEDGGCDHGIVGNRGVKNNLRKILEEAGLWGKYSYEKEIPLEWLHTSAACRLGILQGLMDTDGCPADGSGSAEYSTTSEKLASQVRWLVESLGGICTIHCKEEPIYEHNGEKRIGRKAWRCYVKLPNPEDTFLHSGQKRERMLVRRQRPPLRGIKSVIRDGESECTCIMVEAKDSQYVTRHFIVTHNTIQGLGIVNCLGSRNVLILCPAALKMNWGEEARKWLLHGQNVTVLGMDKDPEVNGPGVFVCNYEQIEKWKSLTHGRIWDVLILDEAQYLGNHLSKRTMATLGDPFDKGAVPAKKIVALSGTPISNRTDELFPLLRRICPDKFKFRRDFIDRYGDGQNLGELQMLLRDRCMVRRLKKQVLKELPEKWVREIPLECTTDAAREATVFYRESKDRYLAAMENPSGTTLADKEQSVREAESAMRAALAAALKATVMCKLDAVGEFVSEAIEEARASGSAKVIVFTLHVAMANYLEKKFVGRCVSLTGEDSNPHRRRDSVRAFQEDPKVELFIGNFKAAATGLTLTAANREIMAELHWNPAIMAQAEDRAHRIGQTRGVVVDYLVCKDTTDEDILRTIKRKRAEAAKALNQE